MGFVVAAFVGGAFLGLLVLILEGVVAYLRHRGTI